MTANIDVTPGSGKTVGTTEIGGVQYQLVIQADLTGAAVDPLGTVNIAQDTAAIKNGSTSLTPKFAAISTATSGDANTLVSAVASKKLRVLAYLLNASAAVNAKFSSDPAGTPAYLTGLHYMAAAGSGAVGNFCPVGLFETASGKALGLNLSGAVTVGGYVVYIEV